jgi:hypothetical protein
MRKAVDVLLLLLAICGGVAAWRTGLERRQLAATYDRLARVTGDLAITDPSKAHLLALETGEPLHFAWRVYLPPNYNVRLRSGLGGQSSSWSSGSIEFIARVRIRQTDRGPLEIYTRFSGGSSLMSIGGPKLAELLRGRWNDVIVEQVGAGGLTALEPGKPAVLLRLKLPDDLAAQAKKVLPPHDVNRVVPVFYELTLGSKP